ncbi:hypothetical protein [Candidatus Pelagibacter communis]|uniref:hypothetical protein n=1 Tax=Pelagibacter ubique TaxID=198252 RepID=UPI00094DDB17|nr:hypothetical protein [Candidatus Pelagibacter ubique]|tara:strand:- start:1028 stop:2278 length:1251 start_codon:yes stop_codon:yes gene_type:complete
MKEHKIYFYLIILISYLIFITGFFIEENITSGAIDWPHVQRMIGSFSEDFNTYFREYENRHSPLLYILLSFLKKIDLNLDAIRFVHLHISFLTLIVIYKCLKIKFNNSINKIYILILSIFIVLFSPNLRTVAYWPLPYNLGLFLLTLSFYFCLKFFDDQNNQIQKNYYLSLNIFFVAMASYISPNFSLFSLYFAYLFLRNQFDKKTIMILLLGNLILSLPALYYFFIYNPFFIFNTSVHPESSALRLNYLNKFVIICSIIFFHLLPFILKFDKDKIKQTIQKKPLILFSFIVFFIFSLFYFNFKPEYGGGGVFLKLSYLVLGNQNLFVFICIFIFSFIYLLTASNLNNLFLLIIFILMNPQLSIYHRYYDPLVLIVFLLFFENNIFKSNLIDKKMIYTLSLFIISFNLLYLLKNYI